MKKKKQLEQIAEDIFLYEQALQQQNKVKNKQEIENKIETIMMSLSLEEMLIIDDIIQKKVF